MYQAVLLDESIALEKVSLKVSFESPEDLNGDRNHIKQLERLSPSFLRFDPVNYPLLFIQLIRIRIYRTGMNRQANKPG